MSILYPIGQSSPFSLDPWTGVITMSGSLDYETKQDYQFDIKAADLGNPSLFNLTIVSILIVNKLLSTYVN